MTRTVDELLLGSGSHRALSLSELMEWEAEYRLRAWEDEQRSKNTK